MSVAHKSKMSADCQSTCFAFVSGCFPSTSITLDDAGLSVHSPARKQHSDIRFRSPERPEKKWEVEHFANPSVAARAEQYPKKMPLQMKGFEVAAKNVKNMKGYAPTKLYSATELAQKCGIGKLFLKAEVDRFGASSFKILGGGYAVQKEMDALGFFSANPVFCTASAGNHGVGVALASQLAKCSCHVFLPSTVSDGMVDRVKRYGATVHRIEGVYEDALAACKEAVNRNGWKHIQDVSAPGYQQIPTRIFEGYGVISAEMLEQLGYSSTVSNSVNDKNYESRDTEEKNKGGNLLPTHVFVNGGVGGLGTSLCSYLWAELGENRPRFVIVEPTASACLQLAAQKEVDPFDTACDMPVSGTSKGTTIQVGLDTKVADVLAWKCLLTGVDDFVSISDDCVQPAIDLLASTKLETVDLGEQSSMAHGHEVDGLASGESGVAALGVLMAAAVRPELQQKLGLTNESRVLVIVCEGPTGVVESH